MKENYRNMREFVKDMAGELKYVLYIAFLYLNIDIEIYTIVFTMMLIDSFTGVVKVLRINYKKFKSTRLIWGLVSKMGLLIIPIILALAAKGIGQDMTLGVELVMKILIVSEFLSIISNLYMIKTKIVVKDIDIFTMLFKSLRLSAFNLLAKYTSIDPNRFLKEDEAKDLENKDEL